MHEKILKIAARHSPLSLVQVKEVMGHFPDLKYEVTGIKRYGERHKEISLKSDIPPDFYTRELDKILLKGKADIAVHSAEDLPYPLPEGLAVAALTEAEDKTDALVSRDNLKLMQLPEGARIGAGSIVQKQELLKIRPGLEIVQVTGVIEERLSMIGENKIDALIIAACDLKRLNLEHLISERLMTRAHSLQGCLAVVSLNVRADIKLLFNKIDIRKTYGRVVLAGAINSDCLTLKADKVLHKADVIYYDDLIDASILNNYSAEKIYVGKRNGSHSADQDYINGLLYESAVSGRQVVRLKSGDPLIFGRAGEEMKYLRERLVEVEVIPGISSAQIAAAENLIPLTHRGIANKLVLLSGHSIDPTEKETLVYFMAASRLKRISLQLLKKGMHGSTPAVIIQNSGRITGKTIITSLQKLKAVKIDSPVILIIGDVVNQYHRSEKMLFLGLDPWSCRLNKTLVHYPLIEVEFLKKRLLDMDKYDAVLFTSRNGVKSILNKHTVKNKKIIAIGPQTRQAVEDYGCRVDYMPETPDLDSLAELVKSLKYDQILYPASQKSDSILQRLENIDIQITYKTRYIRQPELNLNIYSGLIFTSASTVRGYFKIYKNIPGHLQLYVYGGSAAAELKKRGYVIVQTL